MTGFSAISWRLRSQELSTADHTLVMGVLNVTPDSFSDGGRFVDRAGGAHVDAAVAVGVELWRQGADLVDVGGESTRPGADPLPVAEEIDRVIPVIAGLADLGVPVSVDTRRAEVAAAALAAGAEVVNDVSALADGDMAGVCADTGAGVVLMHMLGDPATMQQDPRYDDVVEEVAAYLAGRAEMAVAAGIDPGRICIDPGIGFGKTDAHNLALLANLGRFVATGLPVLVGASRKGFLGRLLDRAGHPVPPAGRDMATAATTALAISAGVAVIRAHEVGGTLQVARTADAIVRATRSDSTGWSGE